MTTEITNICTICRKPATSRSLVDAAQGIYDVSCVRCGDYRISAEKEATMDRQSDAHRAGLVRLFHAANARGNRYCTNDGREIQLE